MTASQPGRRSRQAILREWDASGRPPCRVCGLAFDQGCKYRVSMLWAAVVHPYCLYAQAGRPSPDQMARGVCGFFPDCPVPFSAEYCVCPLVAARNLIFVAARLGETFVAVPSAHSPAVGEAARRAGLGQEYRDVPMREDPAFDDIRKHGMRGPGVTESVWHEPSSWWAPPEFVTVDVGRTIREGRIIAVA